MAEGQNTLRRRIEAKLTSWAGRPINLKEMLVAGLGGPLMIVPTMFFGDVLISLFWMRFIWKGIAWFLSGEQLSPLEEEL